MPAGLLPELHKDEYGIEYVTTKGGNQVAVGEDSRGRTFFIDKGGNLYYDTGDVNIGAYLVQTHRCQTPLRICPALEI